MTSFYGFCSYPHGGWSVFGLMVSSWCGLAATMWGISSCRLFFVDYTTDRIGSSSSGNSESATNTGAAAAAAANNNAANNNNNFIPNDNFGSFFLDPTADLEEPIQQRVGAGLFSWLVPQEGATVWSDGNCAGYNQSQRDHFGDIIFEVSRIFGVLAVLSGIGMVLWILFLSCLSLSKCQIWSMRLVLGLLPIFTGLTFLIFQSTLCQDIVSYQDPSYTTNCTIDQGGLVVIAGAIFWTIAFLISVIYIKSPDADLRLENGRITNAFDAREEQRLRREKQRRISSSSRSSNDRRRLQASGSRNSRSDQNHRGISRSQQHRGNVAITSSHYSHDVESTEIVQLSPRRTSQEI